MATAAGNRARNPGSGVAGLVEAACDIVSAEGLAGLTLRPLAQRLGVSVSVLNNHYGARSDIMAAIIEAARADDGEVLRAWRDRLDRLPSIGFETAADLAEAFLDELASRGRALSLLFLEVLQATAWDATLRASFAPWLRERREVWNTLAARAGAPDSVTASGLAFGYFVDELAYGIVLAGTPAYRMLRRLCLRRLFGGLIPSPDAAGDIDLFAALFDELDLPAAGLSVVHGVETPGDWRRRAARVCATLITHKGVGALTHRAVAAAAEVAPATLGYRFPTQEDLVVAGLEYIVAHLLRFVAAPGADAFGGPREEDTGERLDIGRSTFAVAIAAARMPRLAPCAADMRRRRGINLIQIMRRRGLTDHGFDALSGQVLAIGIIGAANGDGGDEAPEETTERMVSVAVAWSREVAASRR